jgi:5'-nucleotidase
MPYRIERKLVIAVSSSALFDLTESDAIFRQQGARVYKAFQQENVR